MQTKIITLCVAVPLSAFVIAQTVRSRGIAVESQNSSSATDANNRATDKNAWSKEERAGMDALVAPSNQAGQLARRLFSEGKLAEAEKECRRAISLAPPMVGQGLGPGSRWGDDIFKPLLGDILLEQGRNKEALQAYLSRPPLGTRPKDKSLPNLGAALAYCRLGDLQRTRQWAPDSAIIALGNRKNLEGWPGTSDLRSMEATLLLIRGLEKNSHGDDAGAVKEYQKVLQLFPRHARTTYRCARALMSLERYDEAFPLWTRVLQFGDARQVKRAKSRMFQRWPRAKVEAAMREAAKLR